MRRRPVTDNAARPARVRQPAVCRKSCRPPICGPYRRILPFSGNIIGLGGPSHADDHHPADAPCTAASGLPPPKTAPCRCWRRRCCGGPCRLRDVPASGRRGHQPGAAGRCRGRCGAAGRTSAPVPRTVSAATSRSIWPGPCAARYFISRRCSAASAMCGCRCPGLPPRPAARGYPPGRTGRHGAEVEVEGIAVTLRRKGPLHGVDFHAAAAQRGGHNDPADGCLLRRGAAPCCAAPHRSRK